MAQHTFGSKGETLLKLSPLLQSACIPSLLLFSVREWNTDQNRVLRTIGDVFHRPVIVRSSAVGEDSSDSSKAGAYCSVAHVVASDESSLSAAIERVIRSYPTPDDCHQFFVQEMVLDATMSGVAFTRDLDTSAPYLVINFDDCSGTTSSVTSGREGLLKTYVRYRNSPHQPRDERFAALVTLTEELETIFNHADLDIEFAFTAQRQLHLLQVRPIVRPHGHVAISNNFLDDALLRIHKKIRKLNAPHPGIHGESAIFSVMTDWNPAEIIGVRPRALALSLYKEVVTDSIWAYQRHNYGYKDLRSFPLLVSFMGLPYIDVRASLNSFIPKELDDRLTAKLVDYYIRCLAAQPSDHDKVEFNVVFSCYYLSLSRRIQRLLDFGFSELELERIKFSLLTLTNRIINAKESPFLEDLERIELLKVRYSDIITSELPPLDKIYWLIEDCKRYGTLPFAGLARAGFIAVQFLRSFVDEGILSTGEYQAYMQSLNTVTKRLAKALSNVAQGLISTKEFLLEYGHLRPGTYDILSPRYDEDPKLYLRQSQHAPQLPEHAPFAFTEAHRHAIGRLFRENGITASVDEMLGFIQKAIEGREYGKFVFTRSLSQVLLMLGDLGARFGLSKEDISHLDISSVLSLYSNLTNEDLGSQWRVAISRNRRLYHLTTSIRLPQMITHEEQVYDFFIGEVAPNYVTLCRVTEMVVLEEDFPRADLCRKIVLIRSADPGYDWLFSRNIAGLVTMYGGANSHMAIRCAELQIPAVIGCGETNFEAWCRAHLLSIDCANEQVRVIG